MKLLIKNAKTVTGEKINIAIKHKKIVYVGQGLPKDKAAKTIDLKGNSYASFGWIDCHVHCYSNMELYGDCPDEIGVKTGVATVIDAGSCGADAMPEFYKLANKASTNIYAMLNISRVGLISQDELSNMENIDHDLALNIFDNYPNFIVGLKARMSKTVIGNNGIEPLHKALSLSKDTALPLMVHIGSNPPLLADTLSLLGYGHIVTHCFNGKANGILDADTGKIKKEAHQAYERGVAFDVGHGTDSFNFNVAEKALAEGIKATSISTDIYSRNRINGPVYNMSTTIEKLLHVGYTLEEAIEKVTIAPAELFGLSKKGRLQEGQDGDITIFDMEHGEKTLTDSNGAMRTISLQIKPRYTIVGGSLHECI